MSRQMIGLSAVGAVLLLVLAWMFVFSPQNEKIAELQEQTQTQLDQQVLLGGQIEALELVRQSAPEIEAEIALLEAVVPTDSALPSALRQLQAAADDAGIAFTAVTPLRPEPVDIDTAPGLHQLTVGITFTGSYFQTVDFLRRIEDPTISSRGFLVDAVSLAVDDYPLLTVSVQARMFAVLDEPPLPAAERAEAEAAEAAAAEAAEAAAATEEGS